MLLLAPICKLKHNRTAFPKSSHAKMITKMILPHFVTKLNLALMHLKPIGFPESCYAKMTTETIPPHFVTKLNLALLPLKAAKVLPHNCFFSCPLNLNLAYPASSKPLAVRNMNLYPVEKVSKALKLSRLEITN